MVRKSTNKLRRPHEYCATPEELKLIDEALAAVERGEIASNDEVAVVFAKYSPPSSPGSSR